MLPVLPIAVLCRHHAEINLVHQLGGLQGVILALALHQVVSQSAQVGEHQGEKLVFGLATPSRHWCRSSVMSPMGSSIGLNRMWPNSSTWIRGKAIKQMADSSAFRAIYGESEQPGA